jgi:hypothetical protein
MARDLLDNGRTMEMFPDAQQPTDAEKTVFGAVLKRHNGDVNKTIEELAPGWGKERVKFVIAALQANGNSSESDLKTVAHIENQDATVTTSVKVEELLPPTPAPSRGLFITIAEPLANMGIPITPVRPGTKRAFLPDFPAKATTDIDQIYCWGAEYRNHNAACVARAEEGGFWFFEADSTEVTKRIKDATGHDLVAEVPTFRVCSRPGRQHFYFRHNAASIALGNISQSYVIGQDWSVRTHNEYVVAPGSINPVTGLPYEVVSNAPIAEAPQWLIDWLQSQKISGKSTSGSGDDTPRVNGKVPHGSIHGYMLRQAGKMRAIGLEQDEIESALLRLVHKDCEPPIDDDKVRAMAKSICKYEAGSPSIPLSLSNNVVDAAPAAPVVVPSPEVPPEVTTIPFLGDPDAETTDPKSIPPFEESMLVGVVKMMADAICGGTTIPRQYGAHVAKTMMSSILTTYKVQLEGCECARSYFIIFGASGTGKGTSFRRLQGILNGSVIKRPFMHFTDTIDSEAGMRDAFFDIPMEENAPLLYFVDEVLTLGQKADGKKNPEIIGGIIEMANKTVISRVKAKRGKQDSRKTRADAWLILFACAQDGEAFATAFPRKQKQGFPDRFIPEYSGKVDGGKMPVPDNILGLQALLQMVKYASKFAEGGMTLVDDVRVAVDSLWDSQPENVKTSPRLRQQLLLETYFAAFARGSAVAQAQDWAIALKWFERQKAIRRVFFSEEIPDQVGVYIQRLRKILNGMSRDLRAGKPVGGVAQSFVQLATGVGAYLDNDLPTFKRAWESMLHFLVEVNVVGSNGHTYLKVVPTPAENDTWLPPEFKIIHPKK